MIRIVTDSSSDLPQDLASGQGIDIVPLTIRFGEEEFIDKQELSSAQFWDRLTTGQGLPETAAPSAGAFLDVFDRLGHEGADGVVVVALSSDLSATYQSAVIAGEKSATPVKVVDSRSVTMGLGLQVIAAAEHAATGADLESVASAALERTDRVTILAALDTLEFLKRGGRIGGASALIAGLLDIKPLITVKDGVIDAAGRVRTRSKAVEKIVAASVAAPKNGHLALYGGEAPDLDVIADRVRDEAGREVIIGDLGAVVGTHSGPGMVGMAHLAD